MELIWKLTYCDYLDIDECEKKPCENGGTCKDGVASYKCTCSPGFNGKDCENS